MANSNLFTNWKPWHIFMWTTRQADNFRELITLFSPAYRVHFEIITRHNNEAQLILCYQHMYR